MAIEPNPLPAPYLAHFLYPSPNKRRATRRGQWGGCEKDQMAATRLEELALAQCPRKPKKKDGAMAIFNLYA
jgi:hypothetical protein